jgi:hypothetical protein
MATLTDIAFSKRKKPRKQSITQLTDQNDFAQDDRQASHLREIVFFVVAVIVLLVATGLILGHGIEKASGVRLLTGR